MTTYFEALPFEDFVGAVTAKYREWTAEAKQCESFDVKESERAHRALLTTVLNASYDVDAHALRLQSALSVILLAAKDLSDAESSQIESLLQSVVTAMRSQCAALRHRATECLAQSM